MEASGAVTRGRPGMDDYFGPGGKLSELLTGYEHRREQGEMAQGVMRALARGDVGLFEAGTGTGKSLAYLIPAALYALNEEKPVVVSTYTISLQEQLIHKDIPVVQRIFPALKAVLVKGWRNYVCHQRLQSAVCTPPGISSTPSTTAPCPGSRNGPKRQRTAPSQICLFNRSLPSGMRCAPKATAV